MEKSVVFDKLMLEIVKSRYSVFCIVNVLLIEEPMVTLLKSVSSEYDGVVSPLIIEIPFPRTLISGFGTIASAIMLNW